MEPVIRRTEAKAFFANERTFLHWLNMAVTIGSISAALSGVAGHAHRHWGDEYTERAIYVRSTALVMLVLSIVIAIWAGFNFHMRGVRLQYKADGPYDTRTLPVLLTICLTAALITIFAGAIARIKGASDTPPPAPSPAPGPAPSLMAAS